MSASAKAAGLSLGAYLAQAAVRGEMSVELPAEAYRQLATRAEEAGMSPGAYLVMAATSGTAGLDGPGWTIQQRRSLGAELFSIRRGLQGAWENLNRLTKIGQGQGRVPPEAPATAAAIERYLPRLEAVMVHLDPSTERMARRSP